MADPQTPTVLDQEAVLGLMREGDEFGPLDAEDILLLWKPKARRRFRAIDKSLRELLADIQTVFPDAQYYTASGGFNLMLGDPHSSNGGGQQSELIALSGTASIGDGDF